MDINIFVPSTLFTWNITTISSLNIERASAGSPMQQRNHFDPFFLWVCTFAWHRIIGISISIWICEPIWMGFVCARIFCMYFTFRLCRFVHFFFRSVTISLTQSWALVAITHSYRLFCASFLFFFLLNVSEYFCCCCCYCILFIACSFAVAALSFTQYKCKRKFILRAFIHTGRARMIYIYAHKNLYYFHSLSLFHSNWSLPRCLCCKQFFFFGVRNVSKMCIIFYCDAT